MASCDMCNKPATTKARIEGAIMTVCASCATYGTELVPPKPAARASQVPLTLRKASPVPQVALELPSDFAKRLRKARMAKGLNEEDAARALAMTKISLLHYESGKLSPDDATARKLAKFFGFSLVEEQE